jgi:Polyprenyl synthetase
VTRSTLAGGKRLRPLFCRYGFLAAGGDPHDRSWLDVAAGIELLHSFALLHDDVMDGSARRGAGRRCIATSARPSPAPCDGFSDSVRCLSLVIGSSLVRHIR